MPAYKEARAQLEDGIDPSSHRTSIKLSEQNTLEPANRN